ncbi:NAD-dependent epimerase/dehydratase family protein [Saccharothrix deserti]|uniref:NAD-dependent epimerase/dehydratase family protein n=1 Tax=Saccharothrix deserti TaxID=2593674 RepID=UPI00131D90C2|nr:NAD-dependent epimerase/dehydratase family protein [Saccharothrix deserti]
MEVVGRGFLAGSIGVLGDRHPGATVLAAGVSSTYVTSAEDFARELDLVCEVARSCVRTGRVLVAFSTASHAMYGATTTPAREDSPVAPVSPYGRNKLALEQVVAESGVKWLVLRLSHVFGAGQREHQLLPSFIHQIRTGTVRLYRGVHRDVVDVADVVSVVDGLLRDGVTGEVVNVASGNPVPVERIVDGIERRMGVTADREHVDAEPMRTVVSLEKLRSLLPCVGPIGGGDYLDAVLDRYVGCY